MDNDQPYDLSNDQAALILQVPPRTLRRWAAQGDVPSLKPPHGYRRFRRADLEAWIERHSTGVAS